jgi:hypothetical protein
MMKNAICLISKIPNEIWLNFLNEFTNYEIFVIIDDNSNDFVTLYKDIFTKINFIQINNDECLVNGYFNSSNISHDQTKNLIYGWDKAIYTFSKIITDYDNVWFIEDDVFISNESSLINIDKKFIRDDLLCESHHISEDENMNGWYHSFHVIPNIGPPRSRSMMCAFRASKRMLNLILNFVNKNKKLFYIEALFTTIAYQNNLTISNPTELATITWANSWNNNEFFTNNLYHPIKNIKEHTNIRNILNKNK